MKLLILISKITKRTMLEKDKQDLLTNLVNEGREQSHRQLFIHQLISQQLEVQDSERERIPLALQGTK